jgi:hypothetical protein
MQESEVLSKVADTVLTKDVQFDVDIIHPGLLDKIMKRTKRSFVISPSTLGTMIKISKEFLAVGLEGYDKENVLDSNFTLITEHAERMARIVAYAVVNSKDDPPKKLVNFFLHNLTAKELMNLVNVIVKQVDVVNFFSSIISVKGLNLLNGTNPKTQGS